MTFDSWTIFDEIFSDSVFEVVNFTALLLTWSFGSWKILKGLPFDTNLISGWNTVYYTKCNACFIFKSLEQLVSLPCIVAWLYDLSTNESTVMHFCLQSWSVIGWRRKVTILRKRRSQNLKKSSTFFKHYSKQNKIFFQILVALYHNVRTLI